MPLRVLPEAVTERVIREAVEENKLGLLSLSGSLYYPEEALELPEVVAKNIVIGEATTIRIKAAVNLTKLESIVKPTKEGRYIQLVNQGPNMIVLINKGGGIAENTFVIDGELVAEKPLKAKQAIWLYWDGSLKRWINSPGIPYATAPSVGANGTVTVGQPGLTKRNIAVIVGDGVTTVWKFKHGMQNNKCSVGAVHELASGNTVIAFPFKFPYTVTGTEITLETAVALAAGEPYWIELNGT